MKKICCNCEIPKSTKEFNKKKDGFQPYCKLCQREKFKDYYKKHKKTWAKDYAEAGERYRKKIEEFIWKFLCSHPCVDCAENNPLVLDFDHLRDKKEHISTMMANGIGIKRLQKEIDKCVIRCANCHRIKTAKENGNWKMRYLSLVGC